MNRLLVKLSHLINGCVLPPMSLPALLEDVEGSISLPFMQCVAYGQDLLALGGNHRTLVARGSSASCANAGTGRGNRLFGCFPSIHDQFRHRLSHRRGDHRLIQFHLLGIRGIGDAQGLTHRKNGIVAISQEPIENSISNVRFHRPDVAAPGRLGAMGSISGIRSIMHRWTMGPSINCRAP